ncbi:MAG: metallophosphoesterase [Thermodesulfobacteriota bacterium]
MKAGILSDTHDRQTAAEAVLELFRSEGVEVILHLGDVCSPEILAGFRASGIPMIGVFGNNDRDRDGLQEATGGAFLEGPAVRELGGRVVLMAHSFREMQTELGEPGRFDLVLFGHTHRSMTMRVGKALVINPGEACGLTQGKATCAVVDLDTMEARILEVSLPEAG